MKQYTYLHVPLATIAVLGFLAYLLACRPSWSPDGSKVLFPYVSEEKGTAGVVLYDRDLKKATSFFSTPFDDGPGILTQWDQRGDAIIVICFNAGGQSDEPAIVHLLPLKADAPKRTYRVEMKSGWLGTSFAQVGSSLFLDGKDLVRLNLEDGTVKRVSVGKNGGIALVQHNKNIFYLMDKSRPKHTESENADVKIEREGEDGEETSANAEDGDAPPIPEQDQPGTNIRISEYEVGLLDPESLRLNAFTTLRLEQNEIVAPYFAVSPDGSSLAFICQKGRKYRLRIIRDKQVQESLPLQLSTQKHGFGNLQWSRDGKTIYAAAGEKVREKSGVSFGIAEIDLKKGVTRMTPLVQAQENDPADALSFFQIHLSPDGKTAAASMAFLDVGVGDHFLLLVDLESPDRKVTKIPVPIDADE